MADPDLYIRHVPADAARAQLLALALERFGYTTAQTTSPIEPALPVLVLWSPTAISNDALIWECAAAARVDTSGPPAPIYEALIAPGACEVSIHPYFGRHIPDRLLKRVDLSEWNCEPDSDQLAPLIWELPRPTSPSPSPPIARPETRDEAQWRALRATGDVAAMARHLGFKIRPVRSREDASLLTREIDDVRSAGAKPSAWLRYGPRTASAAASGPAALRGWADEIAETCTMPDPEAPDGLRRIGAVADLLFAIQICAGLNKRHAFSQDLRSDAEVIALIETGDSKAIQRNRYSSELLAKAKPALERLAKENNAAALNALSYFPLTPEYRRRLLNEKAAELGSVDAIRELIRHLVYRGKFREAIPLMRRGAELGDRECAYELAEALDTGKSVKRNAKEAFAIYNDIAKRDEEWTDKVVALRIAQMQWDGDGCPRDREVAVQSFFDLHIGDEAPYAVAVHIGDLYLDGLGGLAKDRDEAIAWYSGAITYNGVEGAVAGKRLKDLKVKFEDAQDEEEFDEEERERIRTFWRPRG